MLDGERDPIVSTSLSGERSEKEKRPCETRTRVADRYSELDLRPVVALVSGARLVVVVFVVARIGFVAQSAV